MVGGGSRSVQRGVPRPLALVPAHVALTSAESPSLFWWIKTVPPAGTSVVLTVMNDDAIEPLAELELPPPRQAGIQRVRLGDHGVSLAPGVEYEWSISLGADPASHSDDQIANGYVGEVMACHVSLLRDGVLARPSSRTWQHDASLGANTLTIANGHTIDALRFVVGDFSHVAAVVTTQARQWLETDTKRLVDVTSPDNVLVSGRLANGAVASVHVAAVPWAASGFRMEIYGLEGTLVATSEDSPQLGEMVRLFGARASNTLVPLEVPVSYVHVPAGTPSGDPYNVGQMYCAFAQAIRSGKGTQPDFDVAVGLHRFVDAIKRASDTRAEVGVG